MSWAEYARLARELDQVRRDETDQAADRRRAMGAAREEYRELADRLDTQQAQLTELAYRLRVPAPRFTAPAAVPDGSLDRAITEARRHLDAADREAAHLTERASEPRVLPTWSLRARNAAVYAATAACGLVIQVPLMLMQGRVDALTVLSWTFCGLPTVAFFVGYLLVGYLGKPVLAPKPARTSWDPAETKAQARARERAQDQAARTPRMGFVICVVMFPLFFLLWTLAADLVTS